MKAVYIHIPFCVQKCRYCDFVSFSCTDDIKRRYVDCLIKEIELAGEMYAGDEVSTVFIGGGTPSTLQYGEFARVMKALRRAFDLSKTNELTIECNPGTVDEKKLAEYNSCGINRLSFGLQSANDGLLRELSRIHTYGDFLKSLELARRAGFTNINADIMYALPNQGLSDLEETLCAALEQNLTHISAYSLIVEEGTPLYNDVESGKVKLPDEDSAFDMHRFVVEYLKKQGYIRYEISNYAKSGFECRHNLCYWDCGEYIGFGLNSHSAVMRDGIWTRYSNTSNLREYETMTECGKLPVNHTERIEGIDAMNEFLMLGLRKTNGISLEEFEKRFKCNLFSVYGERISDLSDSLKCENGRLYMTERGLDIQNMILCDLLL